MLPPGTDLMVYFNRYVTNDGTDENGPGGGLQEKDFDPYTGYPLFDEEVVAKVSALGYRYCDSGDQLKVRVGGAFGNFYTEPVGSRTVGMPTLMGMVDSYMDYATISAGGGSYDAGFEAFMMYGFRWNNHLYCND